MTKFDREQALSFDSIHEIAGAAKARKRRLKYLNLQLIALGLPTAADPKGTADTVDDASTMMASYRERLQQLDEIRCPADRRIEAFLERYCAGVDLPSPLRLPRRTLTLDRHGLARELSLPANGDKFSNYLVESYRVRNGVLHNPRYDRRTTAGTFHVTEGGLPIPADKKAVPREVFAAMFQHAMRPPQELLQLPFTAEQAEQAATFVSLLIRPVVCPEVAGVCAEKSMEIRFFAPGSLVSNLDFVESIFGNAGDPFLPECDAGLDVEHWSGHTGAVILAPHLEKLRKKDVGLPHYDEATDRQRRDGMCWQNEDELYNEGEPFKLTCRDASGVIVTLIADNYYGYCKKEVKTQLSFATNLYGNVEEEHAGGALAFPSYNLGDEFSADSRRYNNRTLADVLRDYSQWVQQQPGGYGVDRQYPNLIYIPEDAHASIASQTIRWVNNGQEVSIPLLPEHIYMTPAGFKVILQRHPAAPTWRLIGTASRGTFCHKPCTVSGGGKSEISKSLVDFILYGPIFVADLEKDLDVVAEIFQRDYSTRWCEEMQNKPSYATTPSRHVLDPDRSLGSVIKLLTPSQDYTDEYNDWLQSIPSYVYALVFIIKRFYRPEWGNDWRENFSVDLINGDPGHELKYFDRKLVGSYLRVGLSIKNNWRTYKLRQDFAPAAKVQNEDDISVSVVIPGHMLEADGQWAPTTGYKFVTNCEYRLFQRPDEAIHRGLDRQAEHDLSRPGNFLANFEPLTGEQVRHMVKHVVDLEQFTAPMRELLRAVATEGDGYVACSAEPRMIQNKPSKNPRYLQDRPDLVEPMQRYLAEMGTRLYHGLPAEVPVRHPVNAVLFGRRNNPPAREVGIRGLAVYNPIHYQELPELFMDFITSLTGKSPSTTGAGSEGALTKGPFNALLPIIDLNNALVSCVLTRTAGFSTAAGHIGPRHQVDHDISLLIPEIWCRLRPEEQDPKFLIEEELLEPVPDFQDDQGKVLASRLGYRITSRFVRRFFGRVFDNPAKVFIKALLRPETQDEEAFIDGVRYILEAHQRVARLYFEDGSIELACPPLRALLHIMAYGHYEGKTEKDEAIRALFRYDEVVNSSWYRERLVTKQQRDIELWTRHVDYLTQYLATSSRATDQWRDEVENRLEQARDELEKVQSAEYFDSLQGMLGADPMGSVSTEDRSTISAHEEASGVR